jgi:DNA-directed RNA polymerase subunit RPC12/RpoP
MSLIHSKDLIRCPKCSDSRRKKHLATCTVYTSDVGTSYRCFHCGYEELIKSNDIKEVVMEKHIAQPIPEGHYPFTDTAYTYYPYYVNGILMMYVVRKGDGKDKWIRPMIWDGEEWVFTAPKGIQLYRSELLHNDDRPVLIVEGEKAAEAAAKIFTKADVISWQGGAQNINTHNWEILNGRTIILWPLSLIHISEPTRPCH